jgi:hypothetical protein
MKNLGRPKGSSAIKGDRKIINFTCPMSLLRDIKKLAAHFNTPYNVLIRQMLQTQVDLIQDEVCPEIVQLIKLAVLETLKKDNHSSEPTKYPIYPKKRTIQ